MEHLKIDELELVTGGKKTDTNEQQGTFETKKANCPVCKEERVFHLYSGGRAICQTCGKQVMM